MRHDGKQLLNEAQIWFMERDTTLNDQKTLVSVHGSSIKGRSSYLSMHYRHALVCRRLADFRVTMSCNSVSALQAARGAQHTQVRDTNTTCEVKESAPIVHEDVRTLSLLHDSFHKPTQPLGDMSIANVEELSGGCDTAR